MKICVVDMFIRSLFMIFFTVLYTWYFNCVTSKSLLLSNKMEKIFLCFLRDPLDNFKTQKLCYIYHKYSKRLWSYTNLSLCLGYTKLIRDYWIKQLYPNGKILSFLFHLIIFFFLVTYERICIVLSLSFLHLNSNVTSP